MEKSKILSALFFRFSKTFDKELLQDFYTKANKLNLEDSNTTEFLQNFKSQMPEYQALENLYLIEKLYIMEKSLRRIYILLLLLFSLGIIFLIIFITQPK
jgi:hypothetical protein